MNIMLLAYEGDTVKGYSEQLKLAEKLVTKGNKVVIVSDSEYLTRASHAEDSISKFTTYYYNDWVEERKNINFEQHEICNHVAYINYERLQCWKAKKSLKNYIAHVEDDLIDKLYAFLEYIAKKEKIECILFETVSSIMSYVSYYVAQNNGLTYVGWVMSRMPGRYELLHDPYGDIEALRAEFNSIRVETISYEDRDFIRKYLNNVCEIKPDYMKNNPMNMNINYYSRYMHKIGKAIKQLKTILSKESRNEFYFRYPLELKCVMFRYNITRQNKTYLLRKFFEKPVENEKYFLFPLHFQPEASTGVNAPYYCNQAEVIKNIAFSLPTGIKLYVKDHPNGIGFLPLEQYKLMLSLPNVRYINPIENGKKLIMNSLGVITITSTMGYEALLMKKPALTLGKVFYNAHPYCIKASGYDELYSDMLNMIHNTYKDFDNINIRFVKAYMNRTFQGVLHSEEDSDLDKLADNIISAVRRARMIME